MNRTAEQGSFAISYGFIALGLCFLFLIILSAQAYLNLRSRTYDAMVTAACYAAAVPSPFSAANITTMKNIIRTGSLDGSTAVLSPGWDEATSNITITSTTLTDSTATVRPAIRIDVELPVPFLENFANLPIELSYAKILNP